MLASSELNKNIETNSCRALHQLNVHAGFCGVDHAGIEFAKSRFATVHPWALVKRRAMGCMTKWRMKMVEMKDDPRYPMTTSNAQPRYCAVWKVGKMVNGKIVRKEIGSGWREDQADTVALAIRMNGYVLRGYFAGAL